MASWHYRETLRRCKTFREILDKYAGVPHQTDNLAFEMRTEDLISEHLRTYIVSMRQESDKFNKLIDYLVDPNYEAIETAFRFLLKQFMNDGYSDISKKLEQTLDEVSQLERPPDEHVQDRVQKLHDNIDNITHNEMRQILINIRVQIVPPGFEDVSEEGIPPEVHQDTVDTSDESYTELMKAIIGGDIKLVEHIIATNPSCVNSINKLGETSLMLAAKYSTVHIVRTILGCDATDVNLKDSSGRMAVMYAIARGNLDVISVLVDSEKVDMALCDRDGLTCEYYSFGMSMLKYLTLDTLNFDDLKKDKHILESNKITKVIECLLSKQNINQTNLVRASFMFGHEDIILLVLQSGVNTTMITGEFILNIIQTVNPILVQLLDRFQINLRDIDTTRLDAIMRSVMSYNCPDTCAALLDQVTDLNVDNVMKTMLQLQCQRVGGLSHTLKHTTLDVNEKTKHGENVLTLASMYGSDGLVSRLLEFLKQNNTDLNTGDIDGNTALNLASRCGRESIVKLLTQCQGISINSRGMFDRTALHMASERGHVNVVQTLVRCQGIDINVKGNMGRTPLHWASAQGHIGIVRTLTQCQGIDTNVRDGSGWTPLHMASMEGDTNVVKTLVRCQGTDINVRDARGYTPLHRACTSEEEHIEVVRTLVQCQGIVINASNMFGDTPLHSAIERGMKDVVAQLIQCPGIKINATNKSGKTPFQVAQFHLDKPPPLHVFGWRPSEEETQKYHDALSAILLLLQPFQTR